MNINNINNNLNNKNLINNNKIQSNKAEEAARTDMKGSPEDAAESKSVTTDSVSITQSQYGNELQFAHQVLQNQNQVSLNNLKQVKIKIQNKSYEKANIQKAVGNKIQASLNALQSNNISNNQNQLKVDADGDHDGDTSAVNDHDSSKG